MACEGYSTAQVWFRYGSGDWTVFKSNSAPLSYTATPGSGCQTLIKFAWIQCEVYPPFSLILDTSPDGDFTVSKDGNAVVCSNDWGQAYYWLLLKNGSPIYDFNYGTGRNAYNDLAIIEKKPYPAGCSDDCTFKILDATGATLYQKTAPTCPEVVIKCGEACPPETCCECTCADNTVCCYGQDGVAIYSYQK